jgi:membrane protease YdiL (CAAX protease family)
MTSTFTTNQTEMTDQYTLSEILGIWAVVAIPMAVLGWIVAPALAPESIGLGAGVTRISVLTVGLIWQFVLAMIILYREEGDIRWTTIRRRFRLNTPQNSKTGEPQDRLWLWLIPLIILGFVIAFAIKPAIDGLWVSTFPFLAEPSSYSLAGFLDTPEAKAQLVGAWGLLALFIVQAVFNTFLGEEFIFRGVLLPKMNGVFGKWDWVANGVLFGVYHLHQPWGIPGNILDGLFLYAFPARRFRSTWMAIIIHSAESVFFLFLILGLVLGLA